MDEPIGKATDEPIGGAVDEPVVGSAPVGVAADVSTLVPVAAVEAIERVRICSCLILYVCFLSVSMTNLSSLSLLFKLHRGIHIG